MALESLDDFTCWLLLLIQMVVGVSLWGVNMNHGSLFLTNRAWCLFCLCFYG